jgi:hypothetical protein
VSQHKGSWAVSQGASLFCSARTFSPSTYSSANSVSCGLLDAIAYVDDLVASYRRQVGYRSHVLSHFWLGTHMSELPVSKSTVKVCGGVPIWTSPVYRTLWQLESGIKTAPLFLLLLLLLLPSLSTRRSSSSSKNRATCWAWRILCSSKREGSESAEALLVSLDPPLVWCLACCCRRVLRIRSRRF